MVDAFTEIILVMKFTRPSHLLSSSSVSRNSIQHLLVLTKTLCTVTGTRSTGEMSKVMSQVPTLSAGRCLCWLSSLEWLLLQ